MKKLKIVIIIASVSTIIFGAVTVFADNLPNITTACEQENGVLFGFNDGFSNRKKCSGENRRVVSIGQPAGAGKHVLDSAQYQSTDIFTTAAETDIATPSQIKLNCPVKCVLNVNYWADNRTDSIQSDPGQAQAYQIVYVDGVRSNNYASAVFRVVGDTLMVSMGGIFPVVAGEHTVQIYAWQHYGTLDIREKVLTGIAFEQ